MSKRDAILDVQDSTYYAKSFRLLRNGSHSDQEAFNKNEKIPSINAWFPSTTQELWLFTCLACSLHVLNLPQSYYNGPVIPHFGVCTQRRTRVFCGLSLPHCGSKTLTFFRFEQKSHQSSLISFGVCSTHPKQSLDSVTTPFSASKSNHHVDNESTD